MSLIVTVCVPEGLVIAGDSRLTYDWTIGENKYSTPMSDSIPKIFSIKNKFGLGTCAAADINGIPISGFINQFIEKQIKEETTVDQIPELLLDFFCKKSERNINFYVIGYKVEDGISVPHIYWISTENKIISRERFVNEQVIYGANWAGEYDVLDRIMSKVKIQNWVTEEWIDLEYTPFVWSFMTLQDAIDFANYAIHTTIETMRFQERKKTVGGPIDILVIKPNEEPIWIKKKILRSE